MAIIHGNINAGGGSNKPLSEQTYEKTPIQQLQLAIESGETYYLKTSGLPPYDESYGTDHSIIFYQSDSPVSGIAFANQTIDANNTQQVLLTAYTSYSDTVFQGNTFVYYNGAWKRYKNSIIDGQTVINFYTMTSTELDHFYMIMSDRGSINDYDLAIACLQTELTEDRFITTGYEKISLEEKVDDLKNWTYETGSSTTGLFKNPNMEMLKQIYDGMYNGQSRLIYGSFGTPSPDCIYFIGYNNNGEYTYSYLTYYNSTEDEYYNYYSDSPYNQNNVWLKSGEPISGIPPFTYDSTKVVKELAFNCIYGTTTSYTTLEQKLNSISSGSGGGDDPQPQTGLLKNQIYDETTETTGIVDGETYNFKSDMGFSSTDEDLASLQPDDYIYDDGTKNIQFVVETDILSRTFAYLVYTDDSETSYNYTVAQFGNDEPEFINEWSDDTVPSIQVDLSGIINENIFTKMLDVEITDVTVQKTLEQKLSEFKTWIYGYKENSDSQLENKAYNVKMDSINIDFADASNNQQIAVGSDGTELCYFNFYNGGDNVLALNFYNNTANIDLYYHPSFDCWKEVNGTNYSGEQLTFTVNTSNVTDETTLREIIEIEGGSETAVTLEERIETPLKSWTYESTENNSGSSETSIKPIFDSLPILFDNFETFADSGLIDDDYTRELLYQTQSNGIAWSYNTTTNVIQIDYMIPDFDNDIVTVFENTLTPTGPNTGTSAWDVHVEPMLPEGDEMYEVDPITSQDELPVFENFDPTLAESGYSNVVALLVGEVTSSGSSSSGESITLEQKIADLKNWTYENTPESDKFLTIPNWTNILTYISEDFIQLSSYDVYQKQYDSAPWDYIGVNYNSSNDKLGINAYMSGDTYACFNYQYTESTSGDVCDANKWYKVEVTYGPGANPGEPGPASYNYTELTNLPNLTIDATAILIQDMFDSIVVHTNASNLTLDEKLESIGGFSGDYNDLTNKPDLTIYAEIADLGTASTVDVGTSSGNIPVLDANGKLNTSVLPALAITDTFVVSSQAAMLALTAQVGDVAVRTDLNKSYILKTDGASTLANWQELLTPTDAVQSVNGQTGAVTLTQADLNIVYSATQPSNPVTGMIWIAPAS